MKTKRIIAFLLTAVLMLSLTACNNRNGSKVKAELSETVESVTAAEKVDQLIAEIGDVNAESGQAIEHAESEYAKLPDSQKALVKKKDVLDEARKEYDTIPYQEFAEKLFTACAHIFKKPLTIEMEDAWYMIDFAGRYKFTFHFKVANGMGIVEDVYYGNGILPFHELSDEEISSAQYGASVGIGSVFVENGIDAMQQGNPLNAEKIQDYFMKNYK